MDLESLITRDEEAAQQASAIAAETPGYEHTPTLRELRAAYVAYHSAVFFGTPGPRPHGVPQGPEHAEAEVDRAFRAITAEALAQHFADEAKRRGES